MLGKLLKYEIKATARLFRRCMQPCWIFNNKQILKPVQGKPIDNMSAQLFIGIISMTFIMALVKY